MLFLFASKFSNHLYFYSFDEWARRMKPNSHTLTEYTHTFTHTVKSLLIWLSSWFFLFRNEKFDFPISNLIWLVENGDQKILWNVWTNVEIKTSMNCVYSVVKSNMLASWPFKQEVVNLTMQRERERADEAFIVGQDQKFRLHQQQYYTRRNYIQFVLHSRTQKEIHYVLEILFFFSSFFQTINFRYFSFENANWNTGSCSLYRFIYTQCEMRHVFDYVAMPK